MESFQAYLVQLQSRQIAYLCVELMSEQDLSRLLFFSDLQKYEDVSEEEEVDIVYEEEEKENESEKDDDDYGDEQGDDEEEGDNEY